MLTKLTPSFQYFFKSFTTNFFTNIHEQLLNTFLNCRNAEKMKVSIKDFFGNCDKIRRFLRNWPHLLKKSLIENFIFVQFVSILIRTQNFLMKLIMQHNELLLQKIFWTYNSSVSLPYLFTGISIFR